MSEDGLVDDMAAGEGFVTLKFLGVTEQLGEVPCTVEVFNWSRS